MMALRLDELTSDVARDLDGLLQSPTLRDQALHFVACRQKTALGQFFDVKLNEMLHLPNPLT